MKSLFLILCLAPLSAFCDESTTAAPAAAAKAGEEKTVETPKLTQEITEDLFLRVRGAHLRAVQHGKILGKVASSPVQPTKTNN